MRSSDGRQQHVSRCGLSYIDIASLALGRKECTWISDLWCYALFVPIRDSVCFVRRKYHWLVMTTARDNFVLCISYLPPYVALCCLSILALSCGVSYSLPILLHPKALLNSPLQLPCYHALYTFSFTCTHSTGSMAGTGQ